MAEKVAHPGGICPVAAGGTFVVVLHEVVEVVSERTIDAMIASGFKYLEALLETTRKDSLWAENALSLIRVECLSVVC